MHLISHHGCPPRAGILLAASLGLAAFAVQMSPGLSTMLQWQRDQALSLTWLTSHLSHWSWNHLAWDVAVFGFLSWLCLRLMPSRYAWCLGAAAFLIPLEVAYNQPSLLSYRGLSGIDCSLFGLVTAALWRGARLTAKALAVVVTCAFLCKTTFELSTGTTMFVEVGSQPFVPVPSAHLVGFVSGLVIGLLRRAPVWQNGPIAYSMFTRFLP
jgi:hypothetical protein